MRRSASRVLFFCLSAALCLTAGVYLYAGSQREAALPEAPQTGSSLSEQSKDEPALPPPVHAIPAQPAPRASEARNQELSPTAAVHAIPTQPNPLSAGTPEPRNQEPSPAAGRASAYDHDPPGPVVDAPPPAYHYDVIAATEEERRTADEIANQLHAEDAEILAKARSGELAQKDVKPALERRMRTETESLTRIFGADRTTRLLEARSNPGG
jgi:hypothetical protein